MYEIMCNQVNKTSQIHLKKILNILDLMKLNILN